TRLTNFSMYKGGSEYLNAVKTMDLPEIDYMQEDVAGAGLSGSTSVVTPGHTNPLKMKINFRNFSAQNLRLGETEDYVFKGSILHTDSETHKTRNVGCVITTKMHRQKTALGSAEPAKETGAGVDFNVSYMKIEIDGENVREIDKLNFVDSTDGVDSLSEIRSQIGL
ncbi:MAG: phage major tail tube protein, partial [Fusobacteriaceae bacterium]